jgi:hypothetical protein
MALIPALERHRQEDWEFKASLGYTARLPLQNQNPVNKNK